jgi:hypothetical protein
MPCGATKLQTAVNRPDRGVVMQDAGYELPRIPLPETVWKIVSGFLIAYVYWLKRTR